MTTADFVQKKAKKNKKIGGYNGPLNIQILESRFCLLTLLIDRYYKENMINNQNKIPYPIRFYNNDQQVL
jgi:hypothetical protein